MKTKGKLACFIGLPLVVIVLLVVFLPGPLIKWGIEHYGTQTLGAQVDVDNVTFSWWPTRLEVYGLNVTNPMQPLQNALSFETLATDIDIPASLDGTLQIKELTVNGVVIGKPRKHSGAISGVPPHIPFVTPEGQTFKMPEVHLPELDGVIEKEKALYSERAKAFKQQLENKREQWDARLKTLPDKSTLVTYRQRWDEIRAAKDPVSRLAALSKLNALQKDIKADLEKFKQADREMRQEWQAMQVDYAALQNLSAESFVSLLEQWGLSDSLLTDMGRLLVQDKVNEWLNSALGFHQILSARNESTATNTPAARTQAWVIIRKTTLSGPFVHGSRQGEVSGEVLNFSDAPQWVNEPITLRVAAKGTTMGEMQLSGLLDHRVPGKETDTLNFTLKKSQLQDFLLTDHADLQVLLKQARLSMDVSATLQQMHRLDVNLNSAFRAITLQVEGKQASSEVVTALTDALQSVPVITISAVVKGDLPKPTLRVDNNLDEVVAVALRNVLNKKMAIARDKLQARLNEALQKQIAGLESDLAKNSALLDQAGKQGTDFNALLESVKL